MTAALIKVRPFFVGGGAVRRAWGLELALWMVVLIWAGNYIVGKIGMREFLPQIFTCLRFAIATPLMYLVLFWREGKLSFGQVPWGRCLLVGAVGVAIYQTLFIAALKYTTATTVALMLGLSPISTAFVAAFLGYERLRRQMVAGCLLALLGLIFVLGAAGGSWGFREETLFGDMLALAAGVLWGVYPVLMLPHTAKRLRLVGDLPYFFGGDLAIACGNSWRLMVVSLGNGYLGRLGSASLCSYSGDGDQLAFVVLWY